MIKERFAPVNFPVDGKEMSPMVIFKDLTLIYLKVNFLRWCDIGLAEIGASRQLEARVIKHVQSEFIGLLNAVYYIALTTEDETKLEENFDLYCDNYYKKDVEDIPNPFSFLVLFFKGITKESIVSLLWLLMEVVTAQKDKYDYHIDQKHILTLYERYAAVVGSAYKWHKCAKEIQTPRLPATNKQKKKKRRKR